MMKNNLSAYLPKIEKSGYFWESKFSVNGMRCHACINKIKHQIYTAYPFSAVESDFSNKSFKARFKKNPENLKSLVTGINKLGFSVVPYHSKSFRQEIIQLAIAAFSAGNVMLLSIAGYFYKIDPPFDRIFQFISLFLCTFSLIFAARPLWKNTLVGLQYRRIEIDFGILLGVLSAYGFSLINTLRASGEVYFDSIAIVILFVLSGRYIRNRILEKVNDEITDSYVCDPEFTLIKTAAGSTFKASSDIVPGEKIILRAGDLLPVAARVIEGSGSIDLSSINGESNHRQVQAGDQIPAGSYSLDGGLLLNCLEGGQDGFFFKAKQVVEELIHKKAHWQHLTHKLAKIFVLVLTSVVAVMLFAQIGGSWPESIRRSVALLLVACPCALGFGIPLALGRAISELSKSGVMVQNPNGLSYLPQCRTVVFDKTGTLTRSKLEIDQVQIFRDRDLTLSIAASVADYSQHHVPQALSHWAAKVQKATLAAAKLTNINETIGQGLSATIHHLPIKLGKASFTCKKCSHSGSVHLNVDGKCIASFELSESLHEGSQELFGYLQQRKMHPYILSGDQHTRALMTAKKLQLEKTHVISEQSPEDKLNYVLGKDILMVGNGLNDMMAFSASKVAIAVHDSQALARSKADFVLIRDEITGVQEILKASLILQKVLRRLYLFSFTYNFGALTAAVLGWVNPLVAAILMPISSLCTIKLASSWEKS